jgi:hypothetical protein
MQVSTSESIVYNRSHDHKSLWRGVLLLVLFFHLGLSLEANAASPGMVAAKIPSGVAERLAAGAPQELIIEFDDTAVNEEVATK